MKQGMGGQVEAVYDKLHRMKAAFIYSSVALRMEIALRAVNPPRPSTRGFAHHNSLEIQHLHRKHRSLIGSVRHNRLTMRDLHRTPSHGPCMVLVWSLYGPCMVLVWSLYGPTIVRLWSYGGWPVCLLEDSLVGACLPGVRCRACLTPGARLEQAGSLSRHENSVLTNLNHRVGTAGGIRAGAKRDGKGSAVADSSEDRCIHPKGACSRSGAAEVDGGDVGLPPLRDQCSHLGPLAGAAAL